MESQFQQIADQGKQPEPSAQPQQGATPAAPAPAQPAQAAPQQPAQDLSGQFSQMEKAENPPASTTGTQQQSANDDNSEAAKELARKQGAAKHGILARAWDWVNEPILDNILPEGVKTADIIKAAAFEKMYNEAYIPGVNDFNTKAMTHFEPAEKMAAALGPKDKDGAIKKNIRQFLVDHASAIDATGNAVNTGTAGAVRDTADMGAGFTSPLSLGTLGLGKAGRVGKVLAPLVGTAFGLQGLGQAGEGAQKLARTTTWENLKHGYLDPDAVQEVLGGTGQAALGATAPVHGASDLTDFAREKARPVMETVGGQEVPVRAKGVVAEAVQKGVDSSVNDAATAKTQAAVQKGIGNVVGEGVGSEAQTKVANQDRLGIRSHAADLKEAATEAMDELNRQSNGDYEDAKSMMEKSQRDFTTKGREDYNTAKALHDDIIEQHRQSMADAGFDVNEMKGNYRKAIALEKIATRMESATGPLEGGSGYEVKGDRLAKIIDDMRKVPGHENPSLSKNLFERAGLSEDHINALADLADTLREQQETPKFGSLTKLAAKAIAVAATTHSVGAAGLTGLFEGLTGEKAGEVVGGKVMTKLFGEALTSEPLAKELNQKLKGGVAALSTWDKFQQTVKRLWTEERGEAKIPGTGNDAPTYRDAGRGLHEVVSKTGDVSNGQLLAEDVEDNPDAVRVASHWVANESRGQGLGSAQLETMAKNLADNGKSTLLSDTEMTDSARRSWDRLQSKYPEAVTKTSNGYIFDLTKLENPPTGGSTPSESADSYNASRGKGSVTPVEPGVHPRGTSIADAFEKMGHNPSEPKTAASYKALRDEVNAQWDHAVKDGFQFEPWTKEGQPYANSKEMKADVDDNHHLYFFRGGDIPADHPLAAVDPKTGLTFNDKLRAVHDLYGHAAGGYEFGPKGEEAAYKTHAQMFSPEAIPALTTETRGQNNWVNFGPHMRDEFGNILKKGEPGYPSPTERPFAQQKVGLLPEQFHAGSQVGKLIEKYGTTNDVLKAGFIAPSGDMIPLTGEHDHMLGGKTTEDTREQFIKDTGTIRTRYRMTRAGEEQVFSLPSEITEDQQRRILDAANKLKYGNVVLETVDGKNHQTVEMSTGAKVKEALDKLVTVKSDEQPASISQVANPTRDTNTLAQVREEHPDWSLSQQLQEAAKRVNPRPNPAASEIATRRPTSTKTAVTNAPGQYADMAGVEAASKANPGGGGKLGYAEKLARTVAKYTGIGFSDEDLQSPQKVMDKFINHMTDNLVSLHDAMPEPMRRIARQWYDTANAMAKQMAEKHGITPEQSAGVLAALSPQNAWDNNVALADRVMDTYKNRQNFEYSPKMEAQAAKIKQGKLSRAAQGMLKDIHGKTLAEIDNQPMPERLAKKWGDEADQKWANVKKSQQAMWVRLYDEAHNSPQNPMFHPNGDVVGISPNNRAWIGLDHVAKALRILDNGSVDNINAVMGNGNKIRNFYNNIINPDSPNGHTTIDTHAVGAALFQPLSGDDAEVQHNFGASPKGIAGAPKHAGTGMRGTYPLYAEAYKRAAAKLGLKPRELQSITWEGIRSLMGEEKKTPALKAFARETWDKVQNKELTPQQARDVIIEKAGGFSKPSWMPEDQWDEAMGTGFSPEEFK
jgi:hypothetical protein